MLTVNKPSTFYIEFNNPLPRKFVLKDKKGTYFERFLNGKTPRIKFNIPNEGQYKSPNSFKILKQVDIEIPNIVYSLPPFERNRVKDVTIVNNYDLKDTPARIFTDEGKIEKGALFNTYNNPTKVFFLLHEVGHLYYGITKEDIKRAKEIGGIKGKEWLKKKTLQSEQYCDLFALSHFLQMGYNMSTAMYALTNVLKRTPENKERVLFIYNKLLKKY